MSNSEERVEKSLQDGPNKRQIPNWLRWVVAIGIGAIVIGSLVLVLLPMGLNQDTLRTRLQSQIAAWSGMSLAVKGKAAISFFPFKATLTDVTSNDALGAITVTAKTLEARFSVLSVLTGKVDIKELSLDGASITLRQRSGVKLGQLAENGALRPAIAIAKAAIDADRNNPDLGKITNRPLGSVKLTNSSLTYIWADGREDRLTDLSATLQWLKLRGAAEATGSAFWRGESVNFNIDIATPLLLASGGTSGLDFAFASAPLSFQFNGDTNLASDFFADGKLLLNAASISRVLSWSAAPMIANADMGALEISARLTTANSKLNFGDLKLSLDNNPATGTFEIDPLSTPVKLSGTLAFESLDFDSLAEALPMGQDDSPANVANGSPLRGIDLDLRLSAESAKAGHWPITSVAGTIRVDNGDVLLDLGNGNLAGGEIAGSLHVVGPESARVAAFKFSARNVMADQLIKPEAAFPIISAPVHMQIDLGGGFKDWASFISSAQGSLKAEAGPGTIRNFSADSFVAAIRNGQIFALPESYSGLSAFESATVSADLKQGAAIIDAGELLLAGQRIMLAGAVPYLSGGVALNGLISAQSDPESSASFFVGGSWDKPFVTLVPWPQ